MWCASRLQLGWACWAKLPNSENVNHAVRHISRLNQSYRSCNPINPNLWRDSWILLLQRSCRKSSIYCGKATLYLAWCNCSDSLTDPNGLSLRDKLPCTVTWLKRDVVRLWYCTLQGDKGSFHSWESQFIWHVMALVNYGTLHVVPRPKDTY